MNNFLDAMHSSKPTAYIHKNVIGCMRTDYDEQPESPARVRLAQYNFTDAFQCVSTANGDAGGYVKILGN